MGAISRADIVRGPAQVAFDSVTYQAAQNVGLSFRKLPFPISVGGVTVDQRVSDMQLRARFAPSGKVEGLSSLFALLALPLGSGLFSATDKAAVIKSAARQITLQSAAIIRPPQIRASNTQTLFGDMELAGLITDDTAFGTTDARIADTTGGAPDGVTTADIKTAPWTIGGGNLGAAIETEAGVIVDCVPTLDEYGTDSNGIVQFFLTDLEFSATFIPVIGASAFLDAINIDVARGSSMNATGEDFVLTNGFITVTLNAAEATEIDTSQTVRENFSRQVKLVATRTTSTGALGTVVVPSS